MTERRIPVTEMQFDFMWRVADACRALVMYPDSEYFVKQAWIASRRWEIFQAAQGARVRAICAR